MRKRLWIALGFATVIIAVAITWWTWPTPEIDVARFREVREGMTLPEVESVLGGPPGVYCAGGITGSYWPSWNGPISGEEYKKTGAREWVAEESSIVVIFDIDGRATRVLNGSTTMRRPFLERVRVWMGLADPEPPRIYPVSDLSIPLPPVAAP